jgi:hypothetical protein
MAKFRRLRITALPMRIARALPLSRRIGPCLRRLKDVQWKSSHNLRAAYAIAALVGRGLGRATVLRFGPVKCLDDTKCL